MFSGSRDIRRGVGHPRGGYPALRALAEGEYSCGSRRQQLSLDRRKVVRTALSAVPDTLVVVDAHDEQAPGKRERSRATNQGARAARISPPNKVHLRYDKLYHVGSVI